MREQICRPTIMGMVLAMVAFLVGDFRTTILASQTEAAETSGGDDGVGEIMDD